MDIGNYGSTITTKAMKAKLFFLVAFVLIGAVSCQLVPEVEDMDVELQPFYLGRYESTFSYTWNLDALKAFYNVGHEERLYKNVNIKVINKEKHIFSCLRKSEFPILKPDSLILKKTIDVDFTRHSIILLGLNDEMGSEMGRIRTEGDCYHLYVVAFDENNMSTGHPHPVATSFVVPKIATSSKFALTVIHKKNRTEAENWLRKI